MSNNNSVGFGEYVPHITPKKDTNEDYYICPSCEGDGWKDDLSGPCTYCDGKGVVYQYNWR